MTSPIECELRQLYLWHVNLYSFIKLWSICQMLRYVVMFYLWDSEVCDYGPSVRWWRMWLCSICEMLRFMLRNRWFIRNIGVSSEKRFKEPRGISEWWLLNIWCVLLARELIGLTLLPLTSSKAIIFGVRSLGIGIHFTRMWQSLLIIIHVVV